VGDGDIDVVKAIFSAFARRDLDGVLAHADPEIVFAAVTADYAGHGGPYLGHEGMREYFRDVARVWDDLRLTPDEFHQEDHGILVTGRVTGRSPSRVVSGSAGWVWRLRDGKVVSVDIYSSADHARAAFESERG
jgi:ketosteroid isomerase-like protein